jgi:hypothetical protein
VCKECMFQCETPFQLQVIHEAIGSAITIARAEYARRSHRRDSVRSGV